MSPSNSNTCSTSGTKKFRHAIYDVTINMTSLLSIMTSSLLEDDSVGPGRLEVDSGEQLHCPSYYVALSSDNAWYLFTEKWIKTVYQTGLPAVPSVEGGPLPRETLKQLLLREDKIGRASCRERVCQYV